MRSQQLRASSPLVHGDKVSPAGSPSIAKLVYNSNTSIFVWFTLVCNIYIYIYIHVVHGHIILHTVGSSSQNLEKTRNNLRILAGYPSKTDHHYRKIVEHCNFDGGKDDKYIFLCFFWNPSFRQIIIHLPVDYLLTLRLDARRCRERALLVPKGLCSFNMFPCIGNQRGFKLNY